jgi:NAD(P)-dependent dehydrogenase (short-subunit alcohol dehydrogenase family)
MDRGRRKKEVKSLAQLRDLTGRKALVTGGAGHIAFAASESLIELGATVMLLDCDAGACDARAKQLGKRALSIACDLKDEKAVRSAAQQSIEKLGGLDILIHCAAYVGTTKAPGWSVPFEEQTVSAWNDAMSINVTSAFVLAQESREALTKSGQGSIILLNSIYGTLGPKLALYEGTEMFNPVAYGVSKGGLLQLMRYLATTLAPRVRVNCISVGGVWRDQPKEFRQRYEADTPLRRMATEEETKGAIAYLASDLSAYVTGHNLIVDGGWSAW